MKGNLQTNTCDTDRLESYLNGELREVQELEFTAHLDQCEPCRRSLEQRAADPESWSEAEQLLKPLRLGAEHLAAPRSQAPQIQQVLDALAPTDDPAMLGRLGGYEVSGVVGAGGMGVVLKAVDKSLDRTVAIKVMSPHLATSGGARKRFAREAKAAAAVLHPNVIAIHGVSNDESLPYLVMPYIRGASLQKRLDSEGPLALTEILRIGSQIAAGLSAAHAQGLVHRDIKPANILLEDGIERVAITDFGLARAVDDATITRSGVIAGTPQYMSPEQARGESIDQRSDLFSLGSVLYAICTGRPPFRAETTFGVMRRITDDEPKSIREINPDIPDWLCVIVKRLMSKRASDRFESAEEVQELLEQCLAHVQQPDSVPLPESLVPQPSSGGSFFRSHRTGVIAMLGAFGFSLLGMLFWQSSEPPDIAGTWTGDEWGTVVLEAKRPGQYEGTYTETVKDTPGTIRVRWSRIERRYNGTWSEGEDRFGELSVRLVGDEIRGAHTTDGTSKINPGTPRLADLTWRRTDKNLGEQKTGSKRQRFEPVEGQADKTNWTVIPPPSFFSKTNWAVMARMTIDGEARIQLPEDKQPRCTIKLLKGSDEAITVQVQDAAKKSKTIVRIARDQSAEVTVDGDGYNINYPSVNVALDDLDASPFAQVIVRRVENQGDTEVNGESSAAASNEKARLQGLDEQELRELSKFPIHRVDDHDAPHVVSPPTPIEVIRELERNQGLKENSLTDLYERKTGNFRVIVEPVYDKVDPPRFLPLVGRASLHRVRFKCTVYYTETDELKWPVPHEAHTQIKEIINIDLDHLHAYDAKTDPAKETSLKLNFFNAPYTEVIKLLASQLDVQVQFDVEPSGTFSYKDENPVPASKVIEILNIDLAKQGLKIVRQPGRLLVRAIESNELKTNSLQGTWEYLSYERNGVVKQYKPETATLSIVGDRWTVGPGLGERVSHRVEIEGDKLTFHGKTSSSSFSGDGGNEPSLAYGLFELNGDSLIYALTPFSPERDVLERNAVPYPSKFDTNFNQEGTDYTVYRLLRKESSSVPESSKSQVDSTVPIYGKRNPQTGERELNPAWANPVRQMLVKANAIELTSGEQRLHCDIPDNVRGDEARKLIGVVAALMPGGRIAWNPETAEIRLIEVDPASWRVAESLLPAAFEAIADPSVLEKPEKVTADDLDSHDPAELIVQAKHLRRISIENLLSDVPALYDTARWFLELSLSLEQEAELRTQARESASRAAKLRANGNEEEARASESRSEVLTTQAAALAAERKVAQRLRDTAEAAREEAKLLAARISVFKEEGKTQEAEQLQQQLNQLLWKLDPDSFRVRDLQNRIIDARTSVNHQVADQLEAERRTLLKTLDERYPGTRQSDSAHGESSTEDISPQ